MKETSFPCLVYLRMIPEEPSPRYLEPQAAQCEISLRDVKYLPPANVIVTFLSVSYESVRLKSPESKVHLLFWFPRRNE